MNPKLKQKFLKNFIASLLLSDLSELEIRQIAEELTWGGLSKELSDILLGDLFPISRSADIELGSKKTSVLEQAYSLCKRRKTPRKILYEYMKIAAPNVVRRPIPPETPIKVALEKFLEKTTPNEAASFINLLSGEQSDPYLKGIIGRNRE